MTNIKMYNISDIKGYKRNSKNHPEKQIEILMKSIQEFGFLNPIIIDSKNEIIAGHGRLAAAKKLGMLEVPCIVADNLTPNQIIAYRLADNKIAELGETNREILKEELEFLKLSQFDISIAGFEVKIPKIEINNVLPSPNKTELTNRAEPAIVYSNSGQSTPERADTTVGYVVQSTEADIPEPQKKEKRCPKCGVLL